MIYAAVGLHQRQRMHRLIAEALAANASEADQHVEALAYHCAAGGQNEQALRAMDGWVIERAPFRGNGFAPGEGRDVIAEFKVDSVRLPNGSQLWRIDADGSERMVAIFDNDGPTWRRVGE